MRTMNFKNLFATLLTILGLTFGGVAMAAGGGTDKGDDKKDDGSYQLPQAGGDDGTDKGDGKKDSDW